jgi:hypothetical protein
MDADPPPAARSSAEPEPIELVLYVSPSSAACARARVALGRILAGCDTSRVRLDVRDLSQGAEGAEEDHVLFTPTLVKRRPRPRAWFVGDLGDAGVVATLMVTLGLERTA